jgi:hypothetical protein
LPAPVTVTYADGRRETQSVDVTVWLNGARESTLTFPPGEILSIDIDAEGFLPDVDRSNNFWDPN